MMHPKLTLLVPSNMFFHRLMRWPRFDHDTENIAVFCDDWKGDNKSEGSPSQSSTITHEKLDDLVPAISPSCGVDDSISGLKTPDQSVPHLRFAALPGLGMAINMVTLTEAERPVYGIDPRWVERPRC